MKVSIFGSGSIGLRHLTNLIKLKKDLKISSIFSYDTRNKKKFLGEIPIDPEIGKSGDDGKPIVELNPEHKISKIFITLAEEIKSNFFQQTKN